MAESQLIPIPLPFPGKGVNTGTELAAQPEGTCPDALNVRVYGPDAKRLRGTKRPGITKSFDADLSDARAITGATDGGGSEDELTVDGDHTDEFATGRTFVVANSTANDGTYTTSSDATYDSGGDETTIFIPTGSLTDTTADGDITSQPIGAEIDELLVAEFVLEQTSDVAVDPLETDDFSSADGWSDTDKLSQASPGAGVPTRWEEYSGVGDTSPTLQQDGAADWAIFDRSPDDDLMAEFREDTGDRAIVIKQTQTVNLGNNYDVFARIRGVGTSSSGPTAPTLGFTGRSAIGSLMGTEGAIMFRANSDRSNYLVLRSNATWGGTGTLTNLILIQRHSSGSLSTLYTSSPTPAKADVFPAGDFPAEYIEWWVKVRGTTVELLVKLDTQASYTLLATFTGVTENVGNVGVGFMCLANNRQVSLDRFEVGVARLGPYGRREQIVLAFGNSQVWKGTVGTDDVLKQIVDGDSPPAAGNVQAVQLFGKVYAVDGTGGYIIRGQDAAGDPVNLNAGTPVIANWSDDVTAGTLPVDCLGITAYRGSIILYGQRTDSNNWYASAVGDALDWDFGADPFETSAFAADNSDLGRNPDSIFAMIPWHDDLMLIGGSHSIRRVTGDPRLGGQIDVITDAIGILGFRAWAIGKGGVVYFVGQDGFYVMPIGGGQPTNLTEAVLEDVLGGVQLASTAVIVRYDPFARGVHIWLTPIEPGENGTHVFFDEIGGGFWPFQYSLTKFQPFAAATLRGNDEANQTVLLGCQDGFIRQHDPTVNNDDGEAISAYIEYAPFFMARGYREGIIRELQAELASGSGTLSYVLRGAESAVELAAGTFQFGTRAGSFSGTGFRRPTRQSLRFGAASLRLSNAVAGETFGIERFLVRAKPAGRRRRIGS